MKNIDRLKKYLQKNNLDAFIVPSNDPHFSEYVADYWKCRQWISGFTGSAGTVVVTQNNAALWTDSRYFLQAEEQIKESGIALKKMGLPETENINQWLQTNLKQNAKIGIDEKLFSITDFEKLKIENPDLQIVPTNDPFEEIWETRPKMPKNKAKILSGAITGKSTNKKHLDVLKTLNETENTIYIISALDEIAWLVNMRGSDIKFNPTAIAYATMDTQEINLFVDTCKISGKDLSTLKKEKVTIRDYNTFTQFIENIDTTKTVIINKNKISINILEILKRNNIKIRYEQDANGVICTLKSIKNKVEINGFKKAMIYDGVAMVKFLMWIEKNVGKTKITELTVSQKLHEIRAQNKNFVGESFETIAGYAQHGAIVHYEPTPETDFEIKPKGFLLIDSGGQYNYGTTDITRTLHLGNPTTSEKNDYTLVLKGNISLSMAKFPEGTRGSQLDFLARQYLCQMGKNYLHGTGHGVGHFLNVHEGPQSIRMNENPVAIEAGMITSNEPAVYVTGKYGIRIENLILCKPDKETNWGKFIKFETITLCPIDIKPISKKLLTKSEIKWLNSYHKEVYKKLSPHLKKSEKRWLRRKTMPIK